MELLMKEFNKVIKYSQHTLIWNSSFKTAIYGKTNSAKESCNRFLKVANVSYMVFKV
jgi:hypothetical protein